MHKRIDTNYIGKSERNNLKEMLAYALQLSSDEM